MNESGPKLVKMLLDSLADPNASADPGDEYMSMCDPACVTNEAMVSEVGLLLLNFTQYNLILSYLLKNTYRSFCLI